MAYTSPTRWSSGWNARPLPRRLQVRARQEPSVSDAARKRSRVFLPSRPPTRPFKPASPVKWLLRSDGASSPEVRKHMPALPCSALPCRLLSLEGGLRMPMPMRHAPCALSWVGGHPFLPVFFLFLGGRGGLTMPMPVPRRSKLVVTPPCPFSCISAIMRGAGLLPPLPIPMPMPVRSRLVATPFFVSESGVGLPPPYAHSYARAYAHAQAL